jgi:hypothetical protein
MCFSAAGSFILSGVLTGIGAASVGRNDSVRHRMFATVPFVFAAQQAAEGVVWLTIGPTPPTTPQRMAVAAFLAFALVVWPVWLPLSLRELERRPPRRRALGGLFWFGCVVAAYATYLMTRWRPVAHVAGHSIAYDYAQSNGGSGQVLYFLAYLVPAIVPFFVSTMNMARTMGATLIGSLVVTVLVRRDALTSLWCFFAAILSGLLFVSLGRERRALAQPALAPAVRP